LEPVLRDVLHGILEGVPVSVRLEIQSNSLTLDQMTLIVLLVSEAATNALKHVFGPEQGTSFEVSLTKQPGNRLQLTVRDNGRGLGPAPMPSAPAQKLGLRIMHALAVQLGGKLEPLEGRGATLRVEFALR
jgi:two-component sensor histidine kinase